MKEGIPIVDFIETYNHHALNSYEYSSEFTKNIQVRAKIFATFNSRSLPFGIIVEGRKTFQEKKTIISELHIE